MNYLQNYSIKAKNDIILERFSIKECTKDFISRFILNYVFAGQCLSDFYE